MHFFATSAQISSEFGFEHSIVMTTIDGLTYPQAILDQIQVYELAPGIKIAQVTEPGYNAVVMNLPQNAGGDDELLMRWKEQFLFNKAPSVNTLIAAQAVLPVGINSAIPRGMIASAKNVISDQARKKAEELISSGQLDQMINEPYSTIHKTISEQLAGEEPGYQNVRIYAMARRKALGGV